MINNKYIASIDIGTNSFHLSVAKIIGNRKFIIVQNRREVLRLTGETKGRTTKIAEKKILESITVLQKFKNISDKYTNKVFAVATSAVREAENREEYIKRVYKETKIKIEIIDGLTEANLIYKGVSSHISIDNQKSLCVDIGGGSTEFILGDKGKILYSKSIRIGAVRLTKKYFPDFIITDERIKKCKLYINKMLNGVKKKIKENSFNIVVGTGGTITSLYYMTAKLNNKNIKVRNKIIPYYEINTFTDYILSKKTKAAREKIPGIDVGRADIIPAGAIILQEIVNELNINKIQLSLYALKEGIIYNQILKMRN